MPGLRPVLAAAIAGLIDGQRAPRRASKDIDVGRNALDPALSKGQGKFKVGDQTLKLDN